MKRILAIAAAATIASFASYACADESVSDSTPYGSMVQVVSGGTVIAWAKVPSNATINISSDALKYAPNPVASTGGTTIVSGNATLVATVGTREIMTLHGDQLIVTTLTPH